jgi:predicted negative regulator of RcsB-dependent stress response
LRRPQPGKGSLSILTAGARGNRHKDYAREVLSFNWDDFYTLQDGELFFEWFRREAARNDRTALVDSRTGVTEMSGVCTHQLADVVVSFVAANQQNQEGVMQTARSLADPALIDRGRNGRRLDQILVPSRLEISEGGQAKQFQDSFPAVVRDSFPSGLPGQGQVSFDLAIPYVPYFAFAEKVAAREQDHPFAKLIVEPVQKITSLMASFAPADHPVYLRHHSTAEGIAKLAEELVGGWTPERQMLARALFYRLVQVVTGSHGGGVSEAWAEPSEFPPEVAALLPELERIQAISFGSVASRNCLVVSAHPALRESWNRLREWIKEDTSFLLWFTRLRAARAEWLARGSRDGDLLKGAPLEDADRWLLERREVLHLNEVVFVTESQVAAKRSAVQESLARSARRFAGRLPDRPLLTWIRDKGQNAAIVFIHGAEGDPFRTWGEFPTALDSDKRLLGWDIFSIGYNMPLALDLVGLWTGGASIDQLAKLLDATCSTGPLDRYKAIAFLAHSTGGLVLQRALLDSQALVRRTSHVFLFGTPSAGLTKAGPFSFLKRQSRDLTSGGLFIADLRKRWDTHFSQSTPFRFCTVAGDRDEFVPPNSSLEPFPWYQRAVVPGDHLQIVKAAGPDSLSVQMVIDSLAEGASARDPLTSARLDIESREFADAIDKLWPIRHELDEKGLVDLALALEQTGRQEDAIQVLAQRQGDDLQAMGILAGRLKRRWLAERRRQDAESALGLYTQGMALAEERGRHDLAFYHGINSAFMQIAYRSDYTAAREIAERVLEHCAAARPDKWSLAAQGEALLLLGRTEEALEKYKEAIQQGASSREVDSMYQQAIRLADLCGDEQAGHALPSVFGREPVGNPSSYLA